MGDHLRWACRIHMHMPADCIRQRRRATRIRRMIELDACALHEECCSQMREATHTAGAKSHFARIGLRIGNKVGQRFCGNSRSTHRNHKAIRANIGNGCEILQRIISNLLRQRHGHELRQGANA